MPVKGRTLLDEIRGKTQFGMDDYHFCNTFGGPGPPRLLRGGRLHIRLYNLDAPDTFDFTHYVRNGNLKIEQLRTLCLPAFLLDVEEQRPETAKELEKLLREKGVVPYFEELRERDEVSLVSPKFWRMCSGVGSLE